jgi:DNA/RNA endonuclease YhcR with UshA esterase domain
MRRLTSLLTLIVVAAAFQWLPAAAGAHHAEAPFYDMAKEVTIRGVVTKWQFRNPHPFLYIEVAEDKGAKNEYVVEFVGAVRLAKVGWTAKTFTPGEVVSVTGHPSRMAGTFGISPFHVARADGTIIPGSGRGGANTPEASR